MNLMQENIVGISGLKYNGQYALRYSPAIIFSGNVAAFDINFISPIPNEDRYTVEEAEKQIIARTTVLAVEQDNNDITAKYYTEDTLFYDGMADNCEDKMYTQGEDLIQKSDVLKYAKKLQNDYGFYESKQKEENTDINLEENFTEYSYWFEEKSDNITIKYVIYMSYINNSKANMENIRVYQIQLTQTKYKKQPIVQSIAGKMRNIISTWYNATREIALVGLLCVLVYIAIKGMISGSAGDKAKYKKMLFDWLTAMIIVMTLHYIIALTLTTTEQITKIFETKIIDEEGIDIVFSELRNKIGDEDFMTNLLNTVMYYYLVFMTINYTIVYFKRVVYMAFLTMIAPLIGLTYPLDKIKDGQAQAFTKWIREFIFNALLQPLHLLLYYIFIGSAVMSEFAIKNPFFALVVLSFIKPAEKILRKMFGFDKAGKLGNLEAALKGTAIMNMINSLGIAGKGKPPKTPPENDDRETSNIRMANESNSYEALNTPKEEQTESPEQIEKTNDAGKTKTQQKKLEHQRKMEQKKKEQRRAKGGAKSEIGNESKKTNSEKSNTTKAKQNNNTSKTSSTLRMQKGKTGNSAKMQKDILKQKIEREERRKKVIKGCASVGVKTLKVIAKGTVKNGVKLAGMAAVGTVGLAGGVATGDIGNAIAGLTGGIKAGKNVSEKVMDTAKKAKNVPKHFREVIEEAGYGEKDAERRRKIREFKQTKDYKELLDKFAGAKKEIDDYVNMGIMDASKIRIALTNNYSIDNNVAYINMAKLCPKEIFEDKEKFNVYLESHGIPKENAKEIYKAVKSFK